MITWFLVGLVSLDTDIGCYCPSCFDYPSTEAWRECGEGIQAGYET